jgi:hypothetical protein
VSSRVLTLLAIAFAAFSGYAAYPLFHGEQRGPGETARAQVSCELGAEQIDLLSNRLIVAAAKGVTAPPSAADHSPAAAGSKVDKARAFAQATDVIDRMISDRQVTPEGMREARSLLQESGQTERWVEVSARIAKAVNRGELTLEQAGILPTAQ